MSATTLQRGGREQVMANFADAFAAQDFYGRQPRTELRRDMDVFLPWLGLAGQRNGKPLQGGRLELRRTYSQIVAGVEGWEPQGSCRADQQKYGNAVRRRLEILRSIGWVEDWRPVYAANGEGECIAIVLSPAGVAQSVRPAECGHFRRPRARGDHPPPRSPVPACPAASGDSERGSGRVSTSEIVSARPSDTSLGSSLSSPWKVSHCGAGARSARGAAWDQARLQARARAALTIRSQLEGIEETGASLLEALPWLADVEPAAFGRIVWGLQPDLSQRPPLLSQRWRLRLEAAVRCAERYAHFGRGQRGAGHALIVDLIRGDWREWRDGAYSVDRPYVPFLPAEGPRSQPLSLGAIAVLVRRQAHEWRRHHVLRESRTRRRHRPTAARRGATRREGAGAG